MDSISDKLLLSSMIEKYWEVGQEDYMQLLTERNANGFYICNPQQGKLETIHGHPVKIVGSKGIRMIFAFSDGTHHKVEIDLNS